MDPYFLSTVIYVQFEVLAILACYNQSNAVNHSHQSITTEALTAYIPIGFINATAIPLLAESKSFMPIRTIPSYTESYKSFVFSS